MWVRQEPVFDSPLNLGAHCAKGAAIREHGHGELSAEATPMKLVNGKYQRISWDQALNEIGDKMLELRKESAPTRCSGSASSKHSNEQSYLLRKFVIVLRQQQLRPPGAHLPLDHGRRRRQHVGLRRDDQLVQRHAEHASARCTSARTRPRRTRCRCCTCCTRRRPARKMIVVDPRFTRTAAKADEYVRIRSGTDIAFLFGVLYHIFKNGWEDKKYINDRVYGMDKVKDDVMAKWTPDKVEEVTRRARGAGLQGRRDDGEEPAVDARLVHGPDAAHDRQRDRARVVHPAARARQHRRLGRRRQHLPRPRQRAGRDRRRPQSRLAARLLRRRDGLVEALRRRSGASTTTGSRSSSRRRR